MNNNGHNMRLPNSILLSKKMPLMQEKGNMANCTLALKDATCSYAHAVCSYLMDSLQRGKGSANHPLAGRRGAELC